MRIVDVAELLGKTKLEIEEMLRKNDVIELNLNERKSKNYKENDDLKICE